jgi:hypothetical protein
MTFNKSLNEAVLKKLSESENLSGDSSSFGENKNVSSDNNQDNNINNQISGINNKDIENNDKKAEETITKEDADKKSGLQKRLDRLHREKMEAIEKANKEAERAMELEKKLNAKSQSKDNESEDDFDLDEKSKQYIDKLVAGILESQLKKKDEEEKAKQIQADNKKLSEEFENKLFKAFEKDFDEDSGTFSDEAIEKMKKIYERFQSEPKFWLKAIDTYGIDRVYDLATLKEMPTAMTPKKDSVDKIIEKERLTKSLNSGSSNVSEDISKRKDETQKSYLERIIANAIDKIK